MVLGKMNQGLLERVISEVLDLPYDKGQGKAQKIMLAFLKAITQALQRGERVMVDGFGIFSLRTKPKTRSIVRFFREGKVYHTELRTIKEKRYIHFQPAKDLVRSLNEDPKTHEN